MMTSLSSLSLVVAILLNVCFAAKRPPRSKDLIEKLTSGDYDKSERPDANGGPTNVLFGFYIDNMIVDERNQEIISDAYLEIYWNDTRLTWDEKDGRARFYVGNEDKGKIWQPGIYFPGSKAPPAGDDQEKIEIFRTGRVQYSSRVMMISKCYMNYHKFPFDVQSCRINIEVFRYTTEDVRLESMIEAASFVEKALQSSPFTVPETDVVECTGNNNSTGDYPCLKIQFKLKRGIGHVAKQLFIPSALLMALLYVNFLLGQDILLPRALYLIVIAMLMCTHSMALKVSMTLTLPNITAYTSYEIWIAVYFAFLVLTLIEYCVVAKLCHKPDGVTTEADNKHMRCGKSLDMTMRVLYPVIYFIFVIAFFTNHLVETASST